MGILACVGPVCAGARQLGGQWPAAGPVGRNLQRGRRKHPTRSAWPGWQN